MRLLTTGEKKSSNNLSTEPPSNKRSDGEVSNCKPVELGDPSTTQTQATSCMQRTTWPQSGTNQIITQDTAWTNPWTYSLGAVHGQPQTNSHYQAAPQHQHVAPTNNSNSYLMASMGNHCFPIAQTSNPGVLTMWDGGMAIAQCDSLGQRYTIMKNGGITIV